MLVAPTVSSALRLSAGVIAGVNVGGFLVTALSKVGRFYLLFFGLFLFRFCSMDFPPFFSTSTSSTSTPSGLPPSVLIRTFLQSHKVTDLTGTAAFVASAWATHAAAAAASSSSSSSLSASSSLLSSSLLKPSRGFALALVVTAWGARLSAHLFTRVLKLGKDERLDFLFPGEDDPPLGGPSTFPLKLAGFWAAQGAWAWVCLLPVTVLHGNPTAARGKLGFAGAACVAAALAFIATEAVADSQKNRHYRDPSSKRGKPCTEGLYSVVRFPNYAAEIGVWSSIACAAATAPGVLASAPLAVAASPLFTLSLFLFLFPFLFLFLFLVLLFLSLMSLSRNHPHLLLFQSIAYALTRGEQKKKKQKAHNIFKPTKTKKLQNKTTDTLSSLTAAASRRSRRRTRGNTAKTRTTGGGSGRLPGCSPTFSRS